MGQKNLVKMRNKKMKLPHLGADLVAALAGLQVNDLPHGEADLL
jgi:hypothetical protein